MNHRTKLFIYSAFAVFGIIGGLVEYQKDKNIGIALLIVGACFMLAWSQNFREYIKH
jgi:hypothetical protein